MELFHQEYNRDHEYRRYAKVNFTTNYTSRESRTYIEIENPLAGYTKDPIA
jgi:hypothetical protein